MDMSDEAREIIEADIVEEDVDDCASNFEAIYSILRKYYEGGLEDDQINLLINSATDTLNALKYIREKYRYKKQETIEQRKAKFLEQIKDVCTDKQAEDLFNAFFVQAQEA